MYRFLERLEYSKWVKNYSCWAGGGGAGDALRETTGELPPPPPPGFCRKEADVSTPPAEAAPC